MRRTAAFFDIDHTVLEINSGSKWVSYQRRSGQMGAWQMMQAISWLVRYRFGLLDFEAMAKKILVSYEGKAVEPIFEEVDRWFQSDVAWAICTEARERIADHRARGHVLALLTSATPFLARPVGRALDVAHALCTEVEIIDGHLTGKHVPPVCYGAGKVLRAERFAEEQDVDLDTSFFYTDSVSDLPMLLRVGEPRVVNPDPRLRRLAASKGWPFEIWRAPRPELVQHVGPRAG
jgi:HAD superfamily hydrolase (TIGR01490 family)